MLAGSPSGCRPLWKELPEPWLGSAGSRESSPLLSHRLQQEEGPQERQDQEARLQGGLRAAGEVALGLAGSCCVLGLLLHPDCEGGLDFVGGGELWGFQAAAEPAVAGDLGPPKTACAAIPLQTQTPLPQPWLRQKPECLSI